MKIDSMLTPGGHAGRQSQRFEEAGYDGAWMAEITHDPFLPLVSAAEATDRIELGTGIAVAFARNPMLLANIGYDLQQMSGGRFILGLGSQIKPHITKRFSMPWSKPAARMGEMIDAIHAIWDAWDGDGRLDFEGEFYRHTLMTPMFNPGPAEHGRPPIYVAAVGPLMTTTAAERADGLFLHGFTTAEYARDVTLPAVEAGLANAGRDRGDFVLSVPAMTVSGSTEEKAAEAAAGVRQQLAFYGSTPAYAPVLEHHGWDDLHPELNRLSKQGEWVEMGNLIDDEVVEAFAVVAEPDQLAAKVKERWGPLVDRLSFYSPFSAEPDVWIPVIEELKRS